MVLLIAMCFVPSRQTLYEIYGFGTIVDYAQKNEELKQLPDKAIHAINLWLDTKLPNDNSNKKDKTE